MAKQRDGGIGTLSSIASPETSVFESGWRIGPQEKSGCSKGDTPVYNGDIWQSGDYFSLISLEAGKIKQFRNLIQIDSFINKQIVAVRIKGSEFVGGRGFRNAENEEGEIYIIRSENETSQFIVNARRTVDPFNDGVDFNALVEIGVFSPNDQRERKREIEDFEHSNKLEKKLKETRSNLQKSLLDAGVIQSRKIYNNILSVEERLKEIMKIFWKWADKRITYKDIISYRKLLKVPDWTGKKIEKVFKIQQKSGHGEIEYPDILFLKFEDGSISIPFSTISPNKHHWVDFDLNGLEEAGFISKSEITEVKKKFDQVQSETKNEGEMKNRLWKLENDLLEFDHGLKNTKRVVRKIKFLKEELGIA